MSLLRRIFNFSARRQPVTAPAKLLQSPVTHEEARRLFNRIARRNDLCLEYGSDGCFARADLICRDLQHRGYTPFKAWAVGQMTVSLSRYKKLSWHYHVAPALAVSNDDGSVVPMVFDPVLFDGPVTLEGWTAPLTPVESPLTLRLRAHGKSFFKFNRRGDGYSLDRTHAPYKKRLKDARADLRAYRKSEKPLYNRKFESRFDG